MNFKIDSLINDSSSFGIVGANISKALDNLGHSVKVQRWKESDSAIKAPNDVLLSTDYMVRVSHPHGGVEGGNTNILLTVCESTGIYKKYNFGKGINFIATPSSWCSKVISDHTHIPTRVWNHGGTWVADPKTTINKGRKRILLIGCLDERKYAKEFIKLFHENFSSESAELIVKSQKGYTMHEEANNITLIDDNLSVAELAELYKSCDILALPSRGEAFGLTGLDASGYGLPILATNYSGPTDYLPDCAATLIDYDIKDTPEGGPWAGQWAEPKNDSILEGLNSLLSSDVAYEEALDKVNFLRSNWSWEAGTTRFLETV